MFEYKSLTSNTLYTSEQIKTIKLTSFIQCSPKQPSPSCNISAFSTETKERFTLLLI